MARRSSLLALALALAALAAPAAARADVTLTFESPPPAGTVITHQYENAGVYAGSGVIFGPDANGPGLFSPSPRIVTVPAGAHSGTQAIGAGPSCVPPRKRPRTRRLAALPPGCTMFGGRFPFAKQRVAATVLDTASTLPGDTVELDGYDASGTLVKSDVRTLNLGGPVLLSIAVGGPQIVFWQILRDAAPASLTIDDLTFDLPATPPPPDFAITPGQRGLILGPDGVLQGGSTSYPIQVVRIDNSTGAVHVTVDPTTLPAGVTASVSPQDVTDTFGGTVTVTLTAASNAPQQINRFVRVIGTPVPTPGAGSVAHTTQFRTSVWEIDNYDLQIDGVEVSQVVQRQSIPSGSGAVTYSGVRLVEGRRTIVRVWISNARPVPLGSMAAPVVQLEGFDAVNGKPLPESPIFADASPSTIPSNHALMVTPAERRDNATAYTFTLPAAKPEDDGWGPRHRGWAYGRINLRVTAFADNSDPRTLECVGCAANNSLSILGLPFEAMRSFEIVPVALTTSGAAMPSTAAGTMPLDPWTVFGEATTVLPVPLSVRFAYQGRIDIQDIANSGKSRGDQGSDAMGRVTSWFDDAHYYKGALYPVGVASIDLGITNNNVMATHDGDEPPTSVVYGGSTSTPFSSIARPLSSATHELGHGFGRAHASGACGGGSNGQVGEDWPPDQQGFIEGIGVDPSSGRFGQFGPYTVIATSVDGKSPAYDYMSYCAPNWPDSTASQWTSDKGWDEIASRYSYGPAPFARRQPAGVVAARRPAAVAGTLRVGVIAGPSGVKIEWVKPGSTTPVPTSPFSGYEVQTFDAHGQLIADVPMGQILGHVDTGDRKHPAPSVGYAFLLAQVPATGAARIVVLHNGSVAATRVASAHAPTLRLLAPRPRTVLGKRRGPVVVRWRSADADGDHLTARVEWSGNGGKSYLPVYVGPDRGRALLARAFFARTASGRIRVMVDDGFWQRTVTSGRLRSLGVPPAVRILTPKNGARLPDIAPIYLSALAADDAGKTLKGRALTWFAGKRLLGHGTPLGLRGLPPGTRLIRLVVRDRFGRKATATVRVRMRVVRARFRVLGLPKTLPHGAKRLVLQISATAPATLVVGRQRFAVGLRTRRVAIRVKAGRKPLAVRLVLVRAGVRTAKLVRIRRS